MEKEQQQSGSNVNKDVQNNQIEEVKKQQQEIENINCQKEIIEENNQISDNKEDNAEKNKYIESDQIFAKNIANQEDVNQANIEKIEKENINNNQSQKQVKVINSEYYNEQNIPKYDDIVKYENQLREEMEKAPLISEVTLITSLIQEYKGSIFEKSILEITKKYKYIRYVRRDGNCFYRSYIYRLFEHCCLNNDYKSHKEILHKTENCKDLLERNGFEWLVVEEFYNVFINEFKLVMTLDNNDRRRYLDILFTDKEKGNYMIAFVRIYISAYIKENRIMYEDFIFDEDLDSWCRREVEPIDVECDNLQIIAVTNCFNTGVLIENLTEKKIDSMKLPEEGCTRYFIHLFFRPGHYDILYNN